MSRNELIAKIEALNEWERLIAEAQAEAEAIKDSIKAEMLEQQTEELEAGAYIIRWTSVLTNRFDSTAFKREYGELYKRFSYTINIQHLLSLVKLLNPRRIHRNVRL